jgi:hypothetical protein
MRPVVPEWDVRRLGLDSGNVADATAPGTIVLVLRSCSSIAKVAQHVALVRGLNRDLLASVQARGVAADSHRLRETDKEKR